VVKVGVVLSGCGVYDGSEIHEATLAMLFLDRAGAEIVCLAPQVSQVDVIDHVTGKSTGGKRSVLVESARIARGNVRDIRQVKAADLDALLFPGGFGAAKNLCDFTVKGAACTVNSEVERLIREMKAVAKPMGFVCIAPVIAARVLGATVTIGNDPDTAAAINEMGGRHIICGVSEIAVDEENKIVSAPAYMLGPTISKVALGIEKLVDRLLQLASR
jgi:enhancing lycopene biosynthesis protein 2